LILEEKEYILVATLPEFSAQQLFLKGYVDETSIAFALSSFSLWFWDSVVPGFIKSHTPRVLTFSFGHLKFLSRQVSDERTIFALWAHGCQIWVRFYLNSPLCNSAPKTLCKYPTSCLLSVEFINVIVLYQFKLSYTAVKAWSLEN